MEPNQSGKAFTLTTQAGDAISGATLRNSDAAGLSASNDPRLNKQLAMITGRRLSQFSMATGGIRLAFWGDDATSVGREILIEHPTLELSRAREATETYQWNDDVVATSLLSVLDHKVTRIDLTDGYLSVEFDSQLRLRVEPDQHYESPGRSVQTTTCSLSARQAATSPSGIPTRTANPRW